ncbi:hypothetical protein ACFRMO_02885 [Streptomyces anulatus]|uniref:hypothetical protein n=1 Tax=Streptomyces anulatus TaxID=1892 RepID=UPI0036A78409
METPAPAPAEVLSAKKVQAAAERFTRALAAGGGRRHRPDGCRTGRAARPVSHCRYALIGQPETLVILERVEANPFGLRGE